MSGDPRKPVIVPDAARQDAIRDAVRDTLLAATAIGAVRRLFAGLDLEMSEAGGNA